jgi:hypothetical protein
MSAGSPICQGNSETISVNLSGGTAPYTVTLNNGGGTQTSASPVVFTVAPSSTTVYSVTTASDSENCPATVNGSTTVTVNSLPVATITPNPASVSAGSSGNQASGPAGMASYAWTIANGSITSANNLQTITYTSGMEGSVTLGLTVFNPAGCTASGSAMVPITLAPVTTSGWSFRTNYFNSFTFTDALPSAPAIMTLAFDGTNYWSAGGGYANAGYAQYDTNGGLIETFGGGLDFRSVFTNGNGFVLARAYDSGVIYEQTSPGVFAPSGVTLTGGYLDPQASVVLSGAGTEYLAMYNGAVSQWDLGGNFLSTVTLQGYGSLNGETADSTPARGIAAFGDFWLTYNGADIVSVWDTFGNRRVNITLSGAGTNLSGVGTNPYSAYSFSYCNGKVFLVNLPGGTWRGYDVGSVGKVAIYGAPSTASWNSDVQSKILGTGLFAQVDAILASSGYPVPGLTNLQYYEAVLAYTDAAFSSATDLGNALASYVDEGGGVVLATFCFVNAGYGIAGNLVSENDLPFSLSSQAEPGNLTMIEDVPTHPIFTGVSSFNGGTSSYQNSPIAITNGGTQLAHWSDGQPLVGINDIEPGRTVGLNFYPPSSDARSDFWDSSTSGGLLMANSLLWAGKVPPLILSGPASQVQPIGGSATFTVNAVGLPPLAYQWYQNGSNIAGATTNSLTFAVQTNGAGQYSVIVSNSYGLAISEMAALNSPIHFLPFTVSAGGAFSLYLGTADGSPLTADRASRINIFSTTDLSLPFSQWMPLATLPTLTNGLLWVQGLSVTNSETFFQAVESP